jgi:hypothetical protein
MTWNKSETPSVRLPGSDFFNNAALKLEEQTDVKMPVIIDPNNWTTC